MRTGAAIGRHHDCLDALAALIRPDTSPLRRACHAPAPEYEANSLRAIQDALDHSFDPPGVARPPVSSRPASSGTGTP
jgi:hypothetical protein